MMATPARMSDSSDSITFITQSDVFMEELATRKRDPVKSSTLAVYKSYLKTWITPLIGPQTLANFGVPEMRLFVSVLSESLGDKSVNEVVSLAKKIIASAIDERTEQPMYPRTWDSHRIDLPRVVARQQNTPIVTGAEIERAIRESTAL